MGNLVDQFKQEFCKLYGMMLEPLLNVYLQAGDFFLSSLSCTCLSKKHREVSDKVASKGFSVVEDYLKQNEALRGILDKLRTDQARGLLDSHHNGSDKTGLAEYTPEVLSIKDQLAKEQTKAEALLAVVYGEV